MKVLINTKAHKGTVLCKRNNIIELKKNSLKGLFTPISENGRAFCIQGKVGKI